MRALGVALAALGLLHVVTAGAKGWRRHVLAAGGVAGAVVPVAWLAGCPVAAAVGLALSIALEAPLWVAAKAARQPHLVLAALVAMLGARVATAGLWPVAADSVLDRWVTHAALPALQGVDPGTIAYVAGALAFLAAAGNTYVRLLLRSIGSLAPGDARTPGGGRAIGSIERLLIFSLAVAGEATAAALIISAKGILRFAEVRATNAGDVDSVTEYVLVGSLASYALALAFVVPV